MASEALGRTRMHGGRQGVSAIRSRGMPDEARRVGRRASGRNGTRSTPSTGDAVAPYLRMSHFRRRRGHDDGRPRQLGHAASEVQPCLHPMRAGLRAEMPIHPAASPGSPVISMFRSRPSSARKAASVSAIASHRGPTKCPNWSGCSLAWVRKVEPPCSPWRIGSVLRSDPGRRPPAPRLGHRSVRRFLAVLRPPLGLRPPRLGSAVNQPACVPCADRLPHPAEARQRSEELFATLRTECERRSAFDRRARPAVARGRPQQVSRARAAVVTGPRRGTMLGELGIGLDPARRGDLAVRSAGRSTGMRVCRGDGGRLGDGERAVRAPRSVGMAA
jgi:hypothetical protein